MATTKKTTEKDPRNPWLKRLEMQDHWELIGFLPTRYNDYRKLQIGLPEDVKEDDIITISGFVNHISVDRSGKVPRLTADFFTGEDKIRVSFFGREDIWRSQLEGTNVLSGQYKRFGTAHWLGNPRIIHSVFAGRVAPVYPVPDRVQAETVYRKLKENWNSYLIQWLDFAAERGMMNESIKSDLETYLYHAHFPETLEQGESALIKLKQLSAQLLVNHMRLSKLKVAPENGLKPDMSIMDEINSRLRLELTEEQSSVQVGILNAMSENRVLRGMLCGDVGTGKTAVYAGPIGGILKARGKVMVMLPSLVLAGQIYDELYSAFPDYRVALVTGKQKTQAMHSADLLVGTTALLFEKFDHVDLLVVDEQHRFSKKQREYLATHQTHLLEVSATPIPRSAALIKMGMLDYWQLKQRHSKQTIHNQVLGNEKHNHIAFAKIKEQIKAGYQALIVYALREDSEAVDAQSIASAKEKFEKVFPGRVMTLHGRMSEDEKVSVLQGFKNHEADVLLSTTVVEVGVTIPDLRVALIVNAERFGMVTLHQLRGRLARRGGEGWFYMYCPNGASEDSLIRLEDVASTPDGFTLAMKDMERRGVGDLTENADRQTGETLSLLRNLDIDIEMIEACF